MSAQLDAVLAFILGMLIILAASIVIGCLVAFLTFMSCHALADAFDNRRRIYRRIVKSRASPCEPFVRPRNRLAAERASSVNQNVPMHTHGCAEEFNACHRMMGQLRAFESSLRAEREFQNKPM